MQRTGPWYLMLVLGAGLGSAMPAAAGGPLLDVAESLVAPGDAVQATVLGEPGRYYAVAASGQDRGLVVHGRPLRLGSDAVVLATGRLDAEGRAVVEVRPDFAGGTAAKVHLQAVTAPTATFEGLTAAPGKTVRNLAATGRELRAAPAPPGGPAGAGVRLADLAGPAGGRGEVLACLGCVGTAALADGAVTAAKLAPEAASLAAWGLGGNAGTDPATQFVGTRDVQPLELRVANQRVFRLEPPEWIHPTYGTGPNVVGGLAANAVKAGVIGATVAGGGGSAGSCAGAGTPCPNRATDHFATVGGGMGNQAGDDGPAVDTGRFATVAGGRSNTASGPYATVPGGFRAVAPLYGQLAYAAGSFASPGDAQAGLYVLRGGTTDGALTELSLDGSAARLVLTPDATYLFDVQVVARQDDGPGTSAGYRLRGLIRRRSDIDVTEIVDLDVQGLSEGGSATWSAVVAADAVHHALAVQVAGEAGKTIRWVAAVRTVEVVH